MSFLNISQLVSFINSPKFNNFIELMNKNTQSDPAFVESDIKEEYEFAENDDTNSMTTNVNNKNEEIKEYNLVYKTSEDLYLLSSNLNENNTFSEFEMQCNGLIFEKDTNKLVCANNNTMFTLNKFDEINEIIEKNSYEQKKIRIEYCEDGTIIRLYNYKDNWFTATNKCIDAKESFWSSDKSFDKLFWEVFDKNLLTNLDKNYTYIFILLHKENRIVVRHTKNMLIYLNRINNETLQEDYTNLFYNHYGFKRSQIIKSLDKLLSTHPFKRGIIIKLYNEQNNSWYAYKYDFPEYTYVKSIRGNVPQIRFRYLELLKDKDNLNELEKYYNENMFMFEMIKNSLLKLTKTIHKLYIESHVKHSVKVDETNIYYQTLKQLHAYYKTQNQTITFEVVKNKIELMEKHVLRKLLGWI